MDRACSIALREKLQLTPEGQFFYQRGIGILSDLHDAENGASRQATPSGHLRINANVTFGHHFLIPLLPIFSSLYPDITLETVLTDTVVDMLDTRADIAVRAGPLKDSSLRARKIGSAKMAIVASPQYLAQRGTPAHPHDLEKHSLLHVNYARSTSGWPFIIDGEVVHIGGPGALSASDGETLRLLAIQHAGLTRQAMFRVKDDIEQGRLQTVLDNYTADDREDIHAMFLGQGQHMPLRVRAFIDFLVEHVRLDEECMWK